MKLKLTNDRLAIPIMTHPGIEMIGKRVIDAVNDGQIHADAIVALSNAMPSDGATVIMDLTVEAEAFGAVLHISDNEVPSVEKPLLDDLNDVNSLNVPSITAGRVPQYILANKIAAERITDKPIYAGCIGPYSLAGRLFDMSDLMISIYTDSDLVSQLLSKCNEFIIKYVEALKATGVDGVIIAEPAAGLLSNEDATTYSTTYVKEIVKKFQDDEFMIILHNCGNKGHCTQSMIDTGANALHFGNQCDIMSALKDTPKDVIVMGNIDPVGVFRNMKVNDVYDEILRILNLTKDYPNFIISSGCDVPPNVSMDNVKAFYSAVNDFNSNKKK
ncbi:MAG: uroporphyrinogen decarboxylase family protein [Muribaculaceae bacterium]|nr:uroporphyrinogen decarboxylase family protein [Muribaculaceae bacterium]